MPLKTKRKGRENRMPFPTSPPEPGLNRYQQAQLSDALTHAMGRALSQNECEANVTFDTQAELDAASVRLTKTANLEILPGAGSVMFLTEHCTKTQFELRNGSCIRLLLAEAKE